MGGDHSTAQTIFNLRVTKCGRPLMRFAKPRKTSHQDSPEPVEWNDVAVSNQRWSEALKDPETAFKMWASDAEQWLVKSGLLQDELTAWDPFRALLKDKSEGCCEDCRKLIFYNSKDDQFPHPCATG